MIPETRCTRCNAAQDGPGHSRSARERSGGTQAESSSRSPPKPAPTPPGHSVQGLGFKFTVSAFRCGLGFGV
eukprot:824220-Rhodomonas_salina.7